MQSGRRAPYGIDMRESRTRASWWALRHAFIWASRSSSGVGGSVVGSMVGGEGVEGSMVFELVDW